MQWDITAHRLAWLIVAIIAIFAVGWGAIVVPQVRETANKVVELNNLQGVDLKIGGCIPIKGSL